MMGNGKRLAIMQPYFLPYIGYFQLIAAVDKFVVYDDVNYIKRGWINRNRILLNGIAHTFTVPISRASQNTHICDLALVNDGHWRGKLLRTLKQAYANAPYFEQASDLLANVIDYQTTSLSAYLLHSLRALAHHLGLKAEIVDSSSLYHNSELTGQSRILDICKQEQADVYVNPIGGIDLYSRKSFSDQGLALQFLRPRPTSYAQGTAVHVPWLSIIDVLMFNERSTVTRMLSEADLM
ncbi:MAG: WbqC family protein [Burkholderiales bacterium]